MGRATSILKTWLPARVVNGIRALRVRLQAMSDGMRSRQEVFVNIYQRGLWGTASDGYCSGSGSVDQRVVGPYVSAVRETIEREGLRDATFVDLGCGDFRVGSRLVDLAGRYVGVDIVPAVVDANIARHGSGRIEFRCLDIVDDDLPAGDVCFVRQVLQHLGNDEILSVLRKLDRYRAIFVTEHLPDPGADAVPNLDKTHGRAIRLERDSGVFIDRPPFGVRSGAMRLIVSVPVPSDTGVERGHGVIQTWLLRPPLW